MDLGALTMGQSATSYSGHSASIGFDLRSMPGTTIGLDFADTQGGRSDKMQAGPGRNRGRERRAERDVAFKSTSAHRSEQTHSTRASAAYGSTSGIAHTTSGATIVPVGGGSDSQSKSGQG